MTISYLWLALYDGRFVPDQRCWESLVGRLLVCYTSRSMRVTEIYHETTDDNDSGTAQAFSRYARFYDAEEKRNKIARWTRAQNLKYLHATFRPNELILEIGCGTGTEAISLAKSGVRLVATDAAPGMIRHLQGKVSVYEDDAVGTHITALVLPAAHIDKLNDQYGRAGFDGAYSSFGPLNCEPDLAAAANALGGLVRPGGKLVISLLGRYCLWETAWYLLHGQPRQAFRRWDGRAEATVRGAWQDERVHVFYWSAAQVERAFAADFSLLRQSALPWVLPPQYLSGILDRRPRLFRLLAAIEARTASDWPGNVIGDHIRFTFVRKR